MKKLPKSDMGNEPSWTLQDPNNEQGDISSAFTWYNYSCSKKDAKEFVLDYLKAVNQSKDIIASFRSLPDSKYVVQFGWLARMLSLGFQPSEKTKEFFNRNFKELLALAKDSQENDPLPVVVEDTPKVNIQDRIREKATEEAGEIEGLIDEFVKGKCKNPPDMDSYFKSRSLSSVVMKKVCDVFVNRSKEIESVINTTDAQIKEGYSNFSKPELRKFKEFLDAIVVAANKGAETNKPMRKKRKVKEKPASIVVAKMNYMKEFEELQLKSVLPEKMIGASQVWTYNTKTKLLGVYNSDNAKGINVKGSTLQNFNADTSVGKRLRKPEVVLPDLLSAGKIRIKKILSDLTTKESPLTGRMNSDTIIVRVVN